MASKNRPTAPHLSRHLSENARHYAFFQAVELIQANLDRGREVGTHVLAADERIFFEVTNGLGFPTSDIAEIRPMQGTEKAAGERQDDRFVMAVNFLGLHGSSSPLPSYYTEQIARYDAQGSLMKGFFDFFHNRLIGLLHRAWRKYRFYRRYRPGGEDPFSRWMFSLFGLADDEIRASTHIYWPRLLCFAGILSTRNRSPSVLSTVIRHAFNLECVEIEEWVERKVEIAQEQRWSLGGSNSLLGETSVIGDRAPDIQGKLRVVLHDLSYKRFSDFLPHGVDFNRARNLIEFMLRDQFAYDFRLCLAPHQARPLTLDRNDEGRLGWSSFLGLGRPEEPREVLIQARL